MNRFSFILPVALLIASHAAAVEMPTVADSRVTLELVAEQPEIVTPTGLAVDPRGRIWVIENQTHQRTPEYKGPPSDRIRVFEDFDPTGRARKITTFADGFKDSMGLSFGPDGVLYFATRSAVYRFPEPFANNSRSHIVTLQTKGNYPHNGLSGFAWGPDGSLIFGLGENLGEAYKLVGSDGSTLTGGGEGGSVYRAKPDGSKLERIATGFWNPFAQAFDAAGRLFVVDNDPDARGPCRLLHVVDGGDFGYRFRYGRKGVHPFQCWNGELPGTLPMVAGTSEAPSGILPADFTSLPFAGELLVTSWGDHTIERFALTPRGASFAATSKIVVRGGENFRPVAIAVAPDGSVVFTDWVDKSYPVHGKGRLWRLRLKKPPEDDGLRPTKVAGLDRARLVELLGHPKVEIRTAATAALARQGKEAREALAGVL
ncbi:MAG: PVC-type heme-binding CxxCH protein, partial [Gemmataceae bacterium]